VAHPQTDGRHNTDALTSFLFRNKAATFGAKDTNSSSSSFSVADNDRKQETTALDTYSLFLIRNETDTIAAAKSEEEEEKQPQREAADKGKQPAQAAAQAERERGAATLLRRAERAAKAAKAAEPAEGPDTGWLDSWTNMGVAIYGRNNKLLVPGRKQGIVMKEDPAAVADGAVAKPMLEQTEPTTQPSTNTRSSQSAGPPEEQP
jgi:hypothetical protein